MIINKLYIIVGKYDDKHDKYDNKQQNQILTIILFYI